MNPTCPRTNRICWQCTEPCKAPELNEVAMPGPEQPFLGILAPIAETLGVETNLNNRFKLTAKINL